MVDRIKFKEGKQEEFLKLAAKKFGSLRKLAKWLDISFGYLWYYLSGQITLPSTVFEKLLSYVDTDQNIEDWVETRLPPNWGQIKGANISKLRRQKPKKDKESDPFYDPLDKNWGQRKGAIIRNSIYGINLTPQNAIKGLTNQKLTENEKVILDQNRQLNCEFEIKFPVMKENNYICFDFAYFTDGSLKIVEEIESNFSLNIKANWFRIFRLLEKSKFITVPLVVTWFYSYAFNPLMRLVLLENKILPLNFKERSELLLKLFNMNQLNSLLEIKKRETLEEIDLFKKFNNAGAKGEIKKPYSLNEREIINKLTNKNVEINSKVMLKDKFEFMYIFDGLTELNGKEFIVEIFNRNWITDILRRGIGVSFLIDNLFEKEYGKLIVFDSKDVKRIENLKLFKVLKSFKDVEVIDLR